LWKTRNCLSTRTSMLEGCTFEASNGSITIRPDSISSRIVLSLRTTGGAA
jgi:hypothetical protein